MEIIHHHLRELTNFLGATAEEKRKLLQLPFVDFISEPVCGPVVTETFIEDLVWLIEEAAVPVALPFGLVQV